MLEQVLESDLSELQASQSGRRCIDSLIKRPTMDLIKSRAYYTNVRWGAYSMQVRSQWRPGFHPTRSPG